MTARVSAWLLVVGLILVTAAYVAYGLLAGWPTLPVSTPYTALGTLLGTGGCAAGVWLLLAVARGPRRSPTPPARPVPSSPSYRAGRVNTSVQSASLHGQAAAPAGIGGGAAAITQIVPAKGRPGYATGCAQTPWRSRSEDTALLPRPAAPGTSGGSQRAGHGDSRRCDRPAPTSGALTGVAGWWPTVAADGDAATVMLPPVRVEATHRRAVAVPFSGCDQSGTATTLILHSASPSVDRRVGVPQRTADRRARGPAVPAPVEGWRGGDRPTTWGR